MDHRSGLRPLLRAIGLLLLLIGPLSLWLHGQWQRLMAAPMAVYRAGLETPRAGQTRALIVGDSHAWCALPVTELPDSVASVAYKGESLLEMELKLRLLLARGVRPRILLLEADDHVFARPRDQSSNERLIVAVAPLAAYNTVYGRAISSLRLWSLRYLPLADVKNRAFLLQALAEGIKKERGTEQPNPTRLPADRSWATVSQTARDAAVDRRRLDLLGANFSLSPSMRTSWRRIIALAHQQQIRVVAVRYPSSDEYRVATARHYDLRPVAELLRTDPPDAVLDYTTRFAGQPQLFQDADHLNSAGAAALKPQLLADLRRLTAPR
jgi:hypothetical protein